MDRAFLPWVVYLIQRVLGYRPVSSCRAERGRMGGPIDMTRESLRAKETRT